MTALVTKTLTVKRVEMYWNEMHAGSDVVPLQFFNKLSTIYEQSLEPQPNHIQMVDVIAVVVSNLSFNLGQISESLIVQAGVMLACFDEAIQAAQLMNAQRCLNVGHVVFISRCHNFRTSTTRSSIALPGITAHSM